MTLLLVCIVQRAISDTTLTRAADMVSALESEASIGRSFDLRGTIIGYRESALQLAIRDNSGNDIVLAKVTRDLFHDRIIPCAGTTIHASGTIAENKINWALQAECTNLVELSTAKAPVAIPVTGIDIALGKMDYRFVSVTGELQEFYADEIDPDAIYLVINDKTTKVYSALSHRQAAVLEREKPIGATVSVTGICDPSPTSFQRHLGHIVMPFTDDPVTLIRPPPSDPFDAPLLKRTDHIRPFAPKHHSRYRICGSVVAVWQRNRIALRISDGRCVLANLRGHSVPGHGQFIEVVGYPEPNLFTDFLSSSIWRPCDGQLPADKAVDTSIKDLLTDESGRSRINALMIGKTVKIRGTVLDLPTADNAHGVFALKKGKYIVPVDVSTISGSLENIKVGCDIEVSGAWIVDSEGWNPGRSISKSRGFLIVPNAASDIRIMANPPWWTPTKFILAISMLVLSLGLILLWNFSLRRIIGIREREIEAEVSVRVESDVKVYERTRLAVELHDSLAQNLTGAALEIKTALRFADTNHTLMAGHLDLAVKTLESSRMELRNCLWDLRNQTLDAKDMNEAIRQALGNLIHAATFSIRFNVPRSLLSDSAAHALIRIVRELVTNAIRHGRAHSIRIAGNVENGELMFSVRDDGCGFDCENCPNVDQGHFGLQGIRERVKEFNGKLNIESVPGRGTRVAISLNLPRGLQDNRHQT